MKNGLVLQVNITDLNENDAEKVLNTDAVCYDIMHGERKVAEMKEMFFRRYEELKKAAGGL